MKSRRSGGALGGLFTNRRHGISASAAEDHAAHLIAQPLDVLGIFRSAEALGQGEKLLLLALLGLQAALDQFNQDPVGAQPAGPRQVANLYCDTRWQSDALPHGLGFGPH